MLCLPDLLHDALALIVLLPHLVLALRQLRHRPRIELLTARQLRPVVRQTRLDCSPHHHAWQLHVPAFLQQSSFSFCMKTSRATLYDSFFQQVLREDLLGRASLHDLVLEAMCTQASRQLSLRSLRSDWKPPLAAVRNRLLHFALPQIVTACEARRCLPPLMRFRSAGNIFLALPATHEFGFMPSGRTAHRTGNETHHLVQLA